MKTKKKKLKDKLWKLFSLYIRTKYSDPRGYVRCVTCSIKKPIKEMQAGHFIHGGEMIRFDERNVHPQCPRCNKFLHGNLISYTLFIAEKYGEDTIDDLRRLQHSGKTLKIADLEEMIEDTKEEYKFALLFSRNPKY